MCATRPVLAEVGHGAVLFGDDERFRPGDLVNSSQHLREHVHGVRDLAPGAGVRVLDGAHHGRVLAGGLAVREKGQSVAVEQQRRVERVFGAQPADAVAHHGVRLAVELEQTLSRVEALEQVRALLGLSLLDRALLAVVVVLLLAGALDALPQVSLGLALDPHDDGAALVVKDVVEDRQLLDDDPGLRLEQRDHCVLVVVDRQGERLRRRHLRDALLHCDDHRGPLLVRLEPKLVSQREYNCLHWNENFASFMSCE